MKLNIGLFMRPDTLNILGFRVPSANWFNCAINSSLTVRPTERGHYEPVAVEVIPSFENGGMARVRREGRELIKASWTIKSDIFWGDGRPLTGYDYKFAFELSQDPRSNPTDSEANSAIEFMEVDESDPRRFDIYYNRFAWNFHQRVGRALPSHIEGPIWERCCESNLEYQEQTAYRKDPTNPGLYCGPYVISRYDPESITLRRNPHWQRPVARDEVDVFFLTDSSDARIEEMDVIASPGLGHARLDAIMPRLSNTHVLYERHGFWVQQLAFNMKEGPTSDIRIRRAIAAALSAMDRCELTVGPWGRPCDSLMSKRLCEYLSIERFEIEAEDESFENIEVPLHYLDSSRAQRFFDQLQTALAPRGIILVRHAHQTGKYFYELRSGLLEGAFLLSSGVTLEPFLEEWYGQASIADPTRNIQGENWSKWHSEALTACVEEATVSPDFETRIRRYAEFQALMLQDVAAVPLAYGPHPLIARKGIAGVRAPIGPYHETLDLAEWD